MTQDDLGDALDDMDGMDYALIASGPDDEDLDSLQWSDDCDEFIDDECEPVDAMSLPVADIQPKISPIQDSNLARIRNCAWGYKCEQKWENLLVIDSEDRRFCTSCDREVHFCRNRIDLASSVMLNHCVAFNSGLLNILHPASDNASLDDESCVDQGEKDYSNGEFVEVGFVGYLDTDDDIPF